MIDPEELVVTPVWVTQLLDSRGFGQFWPTDEVEQEAVLFRVQDYLAATYNHRWKEEWIEPHVDIKMAVAYLALAEARRPFLLSEVITPGRMITSKSIDGASESYSADAIASLKGRLDPYLSVAQRNLSRHIRTPMTRTIKV